MIYNEEPQKIEVGDLVVGYHVGYHKVTHIKHSSVTYTRVDGNRKVTNSCDIAYCEKINPDELYSKLIKEAAELRDTLIEAMRN